MFMIDQTQESIRHADNKIGLLFAASTVLLGALASSWDRVHGEGGGGVGMLGVVFYGLAALGLAIAYIAMVAGLTPRVKPGLMRHEHNRFSWPSVVAMSIDEFEALSEEHAQIRREAIRQIKALATMADIKFRLFRRALGLVMLCGAAFILSQVLLGEP
jgi:hypothetical protein